MKKRVLVGVLAMAGWAFQANAAVIDMPAGSTVAGEQQAQACFACHGPKGNSTTGQYPRLAGQNAKYIYKQLMDFRSGKRVNPIMSGQAANLTDQQMANLAVYFAAQRGAVTPAKGEILVAGERLYRGGDGSRSVIPCAGCHGPAGRGNMYAGFPKIGGQHPEYVKAQLTAFRAAGRRDNVPSSAKRQNDSPKAGEAGMMQMVASKLSDADIIVLANYIGGLH